jgi:hypothetical protein
VGLSFPAEFSAPPEFSGGVPENFVLWWGTKLHLPTGYSTNPPLFTFE